MGGGSGGKGFGDWAMLASNPVQAVIPEIGGIRDWDPISSGFAYVTGKAFGEDTSGYKPTYAGGPGYTTSAERTAKKTSDAWADYYKAQQEAYRRQVEELQKKSGIKPSKGPPKPQETAGMVAPSLILTDLTEDEYTSLLEDKGK